MASAQLDVGSSELGELLLPTASLERLYAGCRWAQGPLYFPSVRP
jgi:sugar lactone lactonase YvrE